jgi:hypothetical protein
MAIVYRNGRPYLYRSFRRRGRVTSEYLGSGKAAGIMAALEACDRDKRDFARWQEQEDRRELDKLDRSVGEVVERTLALARDVLTAAGYHQHHRGEWRRRRVPRHHESAIGDGGMSEDIVNMDFSQRVMDKSVASLLINCVVCDDDDQHSKNILTTDLNRYAAEVAGPNPTPLERVLAQTAALAWLALRAYEVKSAFDQIPGKPLAHADSHQRRIDRANRRLMSTLKMLATVRRLAVPTAQIKVANPPGNLAGVSDLAPH